MLFPQQSICAGVPLSKVLLAAQIPDKYEFTEFNSIARVSFLIQAVCSTLTELTERYKLFPQIFPRFFTFILGLSV